MKNKKNKTLITICIINLLILTTLLTGITTKTIRIDLNTQIEYLENKISQGDYETKQLTQNYNINIKHELIKELKNNWNQTPGREYHNCIKGHQERKGENLTQKYDYIDIYLTKTTNYEEGAQNHITHAACHEYAEIHKHPSTGCNNILGMQDARSAKKFFERGGNLFLIHCEENQIEVYTRYNLWKGKIMTI